MCTELFLFVSLISAISCDKFRRDSYDYCDPNLKLCRESSSHTMCRYPRPGLSKNCMTDASEPLAAPEKLHVLHLHNKLRSRVASGLEKINREAMPQASNMMELRWDEELEAIAARWAEQCTNVSSVHDECRNTKRFSVSQNIATLDVKDRHSERHIQNFLHKWHARSKYLDPKTIYSFMSVEEHRLVEEYSNMIWAGTYAMGCARVVFRSAFSAAPAGIDERDRTLRTSERLICNYGPAGSVPNRPIYKRGAPCSECPEGTACSTSFRGLCSSSEKVTAFARTNEKAPSSYKMAGETLRFSTGTISPEKSIAFLTPAGETMEILTPPEHAVENGIDTRNKTVKIWAKTGIFYNGKCHCSDVIRSGNKKHGRGGGSKIDALRERFVKKFAGTAEEGMEANGYREEISYLKHGDKCQCIMFISGGITRAALSGMLCCVPVIHVIRQAAIRCLQ